MKKFPGQPLTLVTASAAALILALSGCALEKPVGAQHAVDPARADAGGTLALHTVTGRVDPGCLPQYPRRVDYPIEYAEYYEDVYQCEDSNRTLVIRNLSKEVWVFEPGISVTLVKQHPSAAHFDSIHNQTAHILPGETAMPSERSPFITWAPDARLTASWIGYEAVGERIKALVQKRVEQVVGTGGKTAAALTKCSHAAADSVKLESQGEPTDPQDALDAVEAALTHSRTGVDCAKAVAEMERELKRKMKSKSVPTWTTAAAKVTNSAAAETKMQRALSAAFNFCTSSNVRFKGIGCP